MQLGDRIKSYEKAETSGKFLPGLPIYARIDGRSFSNFTRKMNKPYDEKMSRIMQEVTAFLVKECSAKIGYTQSDEISLLFFAEGESSVFFDGKKQKMVSVIAGLTSAKFMQLALKEFPELCDKTVPSFDCRVFQVPNKTEAMNCFLWRVQDAVKNSISMAAHAMFGHKKLDGKSGNDKLDMLFAEGTNWNDYPKYFKEGTFWQRVTYEREPGIIRSKIDEVIPALKFEDLSTEARINLVFGDYV